MLVNPTECQRRCQEARGANIIKRPFTSLVYIPRVSHARYINPGMNGARGSIRALSARLAGRLRTVAANIFIRAKQVARNRLIFPSFTDGLRTINDVTGSPRTLGYICDEKR